MIQQSTNSIYQIYQLVFNVFNCLLKMMVSTKIKGLRVEILVIRQDIV